MIVMDKLWNVANKRTRLVSTGTMLNKISDDSVTVYYLNEVNMAER